MPTTYYGNATNPSRGASATRTLPISATTDSSPIVVTTIGAHGLSSGDCVEITGAADPAANGAFQITLGTIAPTTTFLLNNSTGTLVGGAHGNVTSITVDPSMTLPNSGEACSAANLALVGEHAADLAPWLYQRTGTYRLVAVYETDNAGSVSSTPWTAAFSPTTITDFNTWYDLTGNLFSGGFAGFTNPPGIILNDLLSIELSFKMIQVCTASLVIVPFVAPAYDTQAAISLDFAGVGPSLVASSAVSLSLTQFTHSTGITAWSPTTKSRGLYVVGAPAVSFGVHLVSQILSASTGALPATTTHVPADLYTCVIHHYRLNT
jgi:hypothetical protein